MTKMTDTQFRTATIVLSLAVLAEGGEVSEYAARTAGAHLNALAALVRKGVLAKRYAPFTLPAGPLAGETVTEAFYSAK